MKEVKEIKVKELPKEYTVTKHIYSYYDPEAHYWDMSVIVIYKEGKELCRFLRNYGSIPMIYVKQCGRDFLITSGDYQCITIVDLEKSEVKSYTDPINRKFGAGFCPINFYYDEYEWGDKITELMIEGCVWGGPFERMYCENINLRHPIPSLNEAKWADEDGVFYDNYEDEEEEDEDGIDE